MSAPKHTPGPWKATRIEHTGKRRRELVYARIDTMRDGALAGVAGTGSEEAVVYRDPNRRRTDAETMANANLIAAAPDLLAAVKCLLSGVPGAEVSARAAIAKAEGRQS